MENAFARITAKKLILMGSAKSAMLMAVLHAKLANLSNAQSASIVRELTLMLLEIANA